MVGFLTTMYMYLQIIVLLFAAVKTAFCDLQIVGHQEKPNYKLPILRIISLDNKTSTSVINNFQTYMYMYLSSTPVMYRSCCHI